MKVALVGQPNCGKSTLFNAVAGYRSETANFPGTTVRLARSQVRVNGCALELVDVPGVYSLTLPAAGDAEPVERAARTLLLGGGADVVINVLDASLLSRSLELRELGLPLVVCLNMMDEAERKGISISAEKLSALLGVPVVETVASRGAGVRELFARVLEAAGRPREAAEALRWRRDVVSVVELMRSHLGNGRACGGRVAAPDFVAVKLLEGDAEVAAAVAPQARAAAARLRARLEATHGRPPEAVIMAERHDRAMHLFEQCARVGHPRPDFRASLDSLLTHPLWGYAALAALLAGFFYVVFGIGAAAEGLLLGGLTRAFAFWTAGWDATTLGYAAARSAWDGFAGGAAIVLPYLVPFLFGLALLEDIGYLPRVAYLLDGLLHRIGLHGTSVLPIVLGYGCSVPACLATRILPSRRDRFLATILATLVPCSARSVVIFALVAFYLGPMWALGIFAFNAAAVFFTGWLWTRLWPEVSPGMILEVPRYQWPSLKMVSRKVWLRLREFIVVSWPLLVAGSLVLGLAEYAGWDRIVNAVLAPLTALLGLPEAVGTTLVFGVLRKELSMLMLMQAVGTTEVSTVMSAVQIVVFTVFITFYIPCLATIVAMSREIGRQLTLAAIGYTFALAVVLALAARLVLTAAGLGYPA